jgi:hypothetical protein
MISNITAGTREQIQAVIEANIIPQLVQLLVTADFDMKKEAAMSISHVTSGGSPAQIKYLVQKGCIKPLCDLLTCNDPHLVTVALQCIENVLKAGELEAPPPNPLGFHPAVECDRSGMKPIVGMRFHLRGENYDLCQAEYDKLNAAEKDQYEAIPPPSCNPYNAFVDEDGGFDKLVKLQNHFVWSQAASTHSNKKDLCKKATHILKTFYGLDS